MVDNYLILINCLILSQRDIHTHVPFPQSPSRVKLQFRVKITFVIYIIITIPIFFTAEVRNIV